MKNSAQESIKPQDGIKAFSLIELLISLIIISLILSAFTPLLIKKINKQNITLGNNKIDCAEKFGESCLSCTEDTCNYCLPINCTRNQYNDPDNQCECKDCSTKFPNCAKCNNRYCEECKEDYSWDGSACTKKEAEHNCQDGYKWNGSECKKKASACNPQFIQMSGYKVTKYNMGNDPNCPKEAIEEAVKEYLKKNDPSGSKGFGAKFIPYGNTCPSSNSKNPGAACHKSWTSCAGAAACCWYGRTAKNCTEYDSSTGTKYYSGCSRTVCTYVAAKTICEALGLQLPPKETVKTWSSYSSQEQLSLCANSTKSQYISCTQILQGCKSETHTGDSEPYHVWTSSYYSSNTNSYVCPAATGGTCADRQHTTGASVRCVKYD